MKKIDLGQAVGILANVGVIAGIAFLGVELRQNNELLEAESRYARNTRAVELYMSSASNRDLAAAFAKLADGDDLDSTDQIQLRSYTLALFRNFEANFDEVQAGNLSEAGQRNAVQSIVRNLGVAVPLPWYDYWQVYRPRARPEFAKWMEEAVFNGNE